MPACSLVMTTVDTQEAADRLIARVLDDRLAACVQAHAVASHYVWKGERQSSPELLLQMKIKTADFEALAQAIREVHPYDTPEIVRLPIEAGDPRYLAWIVEVTR